MRTRYNLTPEEFSIILGFNKKAIKRFENGSLQKDEEDSILKKSVNKSFVLLKLEENKDFFPTERYKEIKNTISQSNIKFIKSGIQYVQSFSKYLYNNKNSNIEKKIYNIAS